MISLIQNRKHAYNTYIAGVSCKTNAIVQETERTNCRYLCLEAQEGPTVCLGSLRIYNCKEPRACFLKTPYNDLPEILTVCGNVKKTSSIHLHVYLLAVQQHGEEASVVFDGSLSKPATHVDITTMSDCIICYEANCQIPMATP